MEIKHCPIFAHLHDVEEWPTLPSARGHLIHFAPSRFCRRLKHGIGEDLIFSCYMYATEELCHKGTLYKSYADLVCPNISCC